MIALLVATNVAALVAVLFFAQSAREWRKSSYWWRETAAEWRRRSDMNRQSRDEVLAQFTAYVEDDRRFMGTITSLNDSIMRGLDRVTQDLDRITHEN